MITFDCPWCAAPVPLTMPGTTSSAPVVRCDDCAIEFDLAPDAAPTERLPDLAAAA
jgi:hypothetical protein